MSKQLMAQMATRFNVQEAEMMQTLKATAFKGQVSDAQMTALLIVANQHGLNPWTKEIYAFPDRQNGIVPVVGVDGWSRIMNEHPQFDGMEFEQDEDSCTCRIFRKDRKHPVQVTEYLSECKRDTGPWKSHPKRMLRHKAMIQCARLAFSYTGIYDEDEAERIVEKDMGSANRVEPARHELQPYPEADFEANLPKWHAAIAAGKKTADEIIAMVSTKGALSDDQKADIRAGQAADADFIAEMEEGEQQ